MWLIGWFDNSRRPFARHTCGGCGYQMYFDLTGDGQVPVAHCCAKAAPYPKRDRQFKKHLFEKVRPLSIEAEGLPPKLTVIASSRLAIVAES